MCVKVREGGDGDIGEAWDKYVLVFVLSDRQILGARRQKIQNLREQNWFIQTNMKLYSCHHTFWQETTKTGRCSYAKAAVFIQYTAIPHLSTRYLLKK